MTLFGASIFVLSADSPLPPRREGDVEGDRLIYSSAAPLGEFRPAPEPPPEPEPRRRGPVPRQAQLIPPQHWVYRELHILADAGVLKGIPSFYFQGGRTYLRGEMATLLSDQIVLIKKEQRLPAPDDLRRLRRVVEEFEPEIVEQRGDADIGFLAVYKIRENLSRAGLRDGDDNFHLHGSNTLGYGWDLEKKNTDFSQNMTLQASRRHLQAHLAFSTAVEDFTQTSPAQRELAVGDQFLVGIDKYSLQWSDKDDARDLEQEHIFGFTSGSSYGQGLTIGNLNLEGVDLNWGQSRERRKFSVIIGRSQSEPSDIVSALHLSSGLRQLPVVWQLQLIHADYDPVNATTLNRSDDTLLGLGLEAEWAGFNWQWESSQKSQRGNAHVLKAARIWQEKYALTLFSRYYNEMVFDYNSPSLYQGISGGDEVEDRGVGLEFNAAFSKSFSWLLVSDSSSTDTGGDIRYVSNEWAYKNDKLKASVGYEREWVEFGFNHVTSLRVSREWLERRLKTTVDWTRDLIDRSGSDNTRLTVVSDFLPGVLSLTSSVSNKESTSGRSLSQQHGLSWNLSPRQFISLQAGFTVPDSSSNSFDASYRLKF